MSARRLGLVMTVILCCPHPRWRPNYRAAGSAASDAFEVTELYQTQDPEVVIAEVRVTAALTTTGQSFDAASIQVLRIRGGRILLFRDFANPRALEDAVHA
jgi:ketosteroid isomerase-like protein